MTPLPRSQLALKVVQRPSYYEGSLLKNSGAKSSVANISVENGADLEPPSAHSLHQIAPLPFEIAPSVVAEAISSLSRVGDTVLDPFCSSGVVGLEAALSERTYLLNDMDPVALTVALARLRPCDLTEVALWLQMSPLNAPASLDGFDSIFSAFYDPATFREISALRRQLLNKSDRLSCFLRGLALGLLHGRGAGGFSVYSPSERAITPEQQFELNEKRNQIPDYRAVAPRLLRKSAMVLQEGVPSILFKPEHRSKITQADPRELSHIRTGTVDLILSNPPIPRHRTVGNGNWLKSWFLGVKPSSTTCSDFTNGTSWSLKMNEVLVEAARVCRQGGRAAFFCDRSFSHIEGGGGTKEHLLSLVQEDLSFCWEPECFLSLPEPKVSITGRKRGMNTLRFRSDPEGLLVLRRK
ncbi:MAG: hypothetical protein ACO3XO_01855 [Bdellovibrionota bacterium]